MAYVQLLLSEDTSGAKTIKKSFVKKDTSSIEKWLLPVSSGKSNLSKKHILFSKIHEILQT